MPQLESPSRPSGARPAGLVTLDGRPYPLESVRIDARAEGGLARTVLTQTYTNPYAEPLEVLYTLPLPADGAVVGYTIRLGETEIRGEVRPREEARREYTEALLEGRAAGLLEQERDDTFTQRLGSLPPGVAARVEIEVLHPLAWRTSAAGAAAGWEYRFPTVAGVRYHGAPERVADAEVLDPDRAATGTPARTELRLALPGVGAAAEAAAQEPWSPSHDVCVAPDGDGRLVTLRRQVRLERDLVVRWPATADGSRPGAALVVGRGLSGDDGRYGLLTIVPPRSPGSVLARDLTLLIDASGSMSGEPLARALALADALLDDLGRSDRFDVQVFSTEQRSLTGGPVVATERAVRSARAALARVRASGGTEMVEAMLAALRPLRGDAQRQVVLLTDGYIGFEAEVVAAVLRELPERSRIHVVGIGSAPNRALTRNVARAGRGVELFLGDAEDDLPATARQLVQATAAPLLAGVRVEGLGGRDGAVVVAPAGARDVMAGRPLVLALQLDGAGETIDVSATAAGERWSARLELAEARTTTIPLGALYGREAIADVELRVAADPDASTQAEGEIERLGLRHRIACRMTSLVAVAETPSVDPRAPRRRERLAVEIPAGLSAEACGIAASPTMTVSFLRAATTLGSPDKAVERSRAVESRPPDEDDFFCRLEEVGPPADLRIAARLLRVEGDMLTIEFEVPSRGVAIPGDGSLLEVLIHDRLGRRTIAVRIVGDASTAPGHYPGGVTVRLCVRLSEPVPRELPLTILGIGSWRIVAGDPDFEAPA